MQKNVAQKWIVYAWTTATMLPKTGDAANITANVRIDGGASNPVDDTNPTELEGGFYIFDITAAESNGDLIVIVPSSVTAGTQVRGVPESAWTVYAPESGSVVADGTNTAQFFKTDLASSVGSYCIGSFLKFTSGILINQVGKISAYNGTSKVVALSSAFTTIPTAADKFIIINQ